MADPEHRESITELIRRGVVLSPDCPSREVLKRMTSLWGLLVLMILRDGTRRFSDLRRAAAGVSEKMLAQTLQGLEADGLIDRHAFPVIPPHVEYSLTPLGVEAAERVAALADWVEVNLPRVMEARAMRQAAE